MVRFGDFELDPRRRELQGPGGVIDLTSRAFDLLVAFLDAPDTLLDKEALFAAAWPGLIVEDNTLQVHISALRKALPPGFIVTVHGRGYKYVGPRPESEAPPAGATAGPPATAGNIARYQLDCVAREAETEALSRLVRQHRLVTIAGPGGVGKTTLAVSVASGLPPPRGGTWMIDLAAIESGAFIMSTLIQTLGVPFHAGSSARASIAAHLGSAETILVFDNCEHVRVDAARIIQGLLGDVPGLRILATSQVPLAITEERIFKLMPFAVGEPGETGSASARFLAYCYERFGEQLDPAESAVVDRLCRRLDGVALALKMAAARAATVGLTTVDGQLQKQLAGLEADWNTSLPRHRSLTASLAWSYDLLEADDQRVLRARSVFPGSFSLEGIAALAGAGAEARVAELARRSLVGRDSMYRSRYRLLDSTRRFAFDKLVAAGEEPAARAAHARFVNALFEESVERWEDMPDEAWRARFSSERDNLRAALAWAKAQPGGQIYAELVSNSWRYFIVEQLGDEGFATVAAAQPFAAAASPRLRARLGHAMGDISRFNARDIIGREALLGAIDWFRTSDDRVGYWQVLALLTWGTIFFRPMSEASPLVEELRGQLEAMPRSKTKAWSLVATGVYAWFGGDVEAGLARARAGLAMHLDLGNAIGRYRSVMNLGEMLHKGGDTARAIALVEEILPEMRKSGRLGQHLANHLSNVALYKYWLGDVAGGTAALLESTPYVIRDGSYWHVCTLQAAAEWRFHEGDVREAALLLGIIDEQISKWPDGRQATEQMQRDKLGSVLGTALGETEFSQLLRQGAELTLLEADQLSGLFPAHQGKLT